MWDFIISGYIPGTDIQVSFELLMTFGLTFFMSLGIVSFVTSRFKIEKQIREIIRLNRIHDISL